jgi:hypothetical protein
VHGPSGEGKSALLAHFAREYSRLRPGAFVLSHYVGCAPGSTDIRHVLHRLCAEIKAHCGLTQEIPEEYKVMFSEKSNFACV